MKKLIQFIRNQVAEYKRVQQLKRDLEALTDPTLIDRMYSHEFEQR